MSLRLSITQLFTFSRRDSDLANSILLCPLFGPSNQRSKMPPQENTVADRERCASLVKDIELCLAKDVPPPQQLSRAKSRIRLRAKVVSGRLPKAPLEIRRLVGNRLGGLRFAKNENGEDVIKGDQRAFQQFLTNHGIDTMGKTEAEATLEAEPEAAPKAEVKATPKAEAKASLNAEMEVISKAEENVSVEASTATKSPSNSSISLAAPSSSYDEGDLSTATVIVSGVTVKEVADIFINLFQDFSTTFSNSSASAGTGSCSYSISTTPYIPDLSSVPVMARVATTSTPSFFESLLSRISSFFLEGGFVKYVSQGIASFCTAFGLTLLHAFIDHFFEDYPVARKRIKLALSGIALILGLTVLGIAIFGLVTGSLAFAPFIVGIIVSLSSAFLGWAAGKAFIAFLNFVLPEWFKNSIRFSNVLHLFGIGDGYIPPPRPDGRHTCHSFYGNLVTGDCTICREKPATEIFVHAELRNGGHDAHLAGCETCANAWEKKQGLSCLCLVQSTARVSLPVHCYDDGVCSENQCVQGELCPTCDRTASVLVRHKNMADDAFTFACCEECLPKFKTETRQYATIKFNL